MGQGLEQWALFVDVVRAGGIRAAAKAQGVPRSTVSRRLTLLEDGLGVRLTQRTTARLQLSDAGEACFERVAHLVDEARLVAAEIADAGREPRGVLRIATTQTFADHMLGALVARYISLHPKVRVELLTSVERIDLAAERVDLAIRSGPLDASSTFTAKKLGDVTVGFFASPAYARRRGLPKTLTDLSEHALLVATNRRGGTQWTAAVKDRRQSIRVLGQVHAENDSFLKQLCEHGVGIVRLPTYLVGPSLERGVLVPVLKSHWMQSDLHLLHPVAPPPKTRAFVTLAVQALGKNQPWNAEPR